MISSIRTCCLLLFCNLFAAGFLHAHEVTLPPGFAAVLIAQELDPTAMALAPDGRIFILEKSDWSESWKRAIAQRSFFCPGGR